MLHRGQLTVTSRWRMTRGHFQLYADFAHYSLLHHEEYLTQILTVPIRGSSFILLLQSSVNLCLQQPSSLEWITRYYLLCKAQFVLTSPHVTFLIHKIITLSIWDKIWILKVQGYLMGGKYILSLQQLLHVSCLHSGSTHQNVIRGTLVHCDWSWFQLENMQSRASPVFL